METHNREFFDCVVHFHGVFSYFYAYHNSRAIIVAHIGAANKIQWPVATHKVNEIATLTHQEQQNLQLKSRSKNSFGACTCNHSSQPHFAAKPKRNAAANEMTDTQQTNSIIVTIQITRLKAHK